MSKLLDCLKLSKLSKGIKGAIKRQAKVLHNAGGIDEAEAGRRAVAMFHDAASSSRVTIAKALMAKANKPAVETPTPPKEEPISAKEEADLRTQFDEGLKAEREALQEETMRAEGFVPLLEAVRALGGLPSRKHKYRQNYSGELDRVLDAVRASSNTRKHGVMLKDVFSQHAESPDLIARKLGFEAPFEMLEALEQEIATGKPRWVRDDGGTKEDQSYSREAGWIDASKAKDTGTSEMFGAELTPRQQNLQAAWQRLTRKQTEGGTLTQAEQQTYLAAEREVGQKYLVDLDAARSEKPSDAADSAKEIDRLSSKRLTGEEVATQADIFTGRPEADKSGQEMLFASIAKEEALWKGQLQGLRDGTFDKTRNLAIGQTPEVLQKSGADTLPIVIRPSVIEKVTGEKHVLTWEELEKLPQAIRDPIMVFQSLTEPGALIVMTELKEGTKTVVAAVHLNRKQARMEVNAVASVYGKDDDGIFLKWIQDGALLYRNTQKSLSWLQSRGLQLPKEGAAKGLGKNIVTEVDLVNSPTPQDGTDGNPAQQPSPGSTPLHASRAAEPDTQKSENPKEGNTSGIADRQPAPDLSASRSRPGETSFNFDLDDTRKTPEQPTLALERRQETVQEPSKSAAELARDNMGLAVSIAKTYRNIPGVELQDVVSEARRGLVSAARSFDPTQGAPFSAYAGASIRNALNTLFGKELRYAQRNETTLDEPANEDGGTETKVDRMAGSDADSVTAPVETRETREQLLGAINELAERPRAVMMARLEGQSLSEIGEQLGVSKQMVAKIEVAGRRAVRAKLEDHKLSGVDSDGILYAATATPIDVHQAQIDQEADGIENPTEVEKEELPSMWKDVYNTHLRGRYDKLNYFVPSAPRENKPGGGDVVRDMERDQALVNASIREFRERIDKSVRESFGDPGWWSKPAAKARLERFKAKILPVASRLNATGYDADGNFKWEFFWQRAGTLSKSLAGAKNVGEGDWIDSGRGDMLRVGKFLNDQGAFQLERPLRDVDQRRIYQEFHEEFPEAAHWLDAFIAPGRENARVVDARGIRLPDFNRFSLQDFYGESPYGELARVDGYTPDVTRSRGVAGMLGSMLKFDWVSGARKRKTGEGRERGELRDLFDGFNLRAVQAHEEKIRRDTAEKLLMTAVKEVPPDGVPTGWARLDQRFFNPIIKAMRASQSLGANQLPLVDEDFGRIANEGDDVDLAILKANQETLRKVVGDSTLFNPKQMVRQEVAQEIIRQFAVTRINNRALAILDALTKRMTTGYLAHPFSWIQNIFSNEIFKSMRAMQRASYGVLRSVAGTIGNDDAVKTDGRIALREARNIMSGLVMDRWWNKASRERMDAMAPMELFEGNNGLQAVAGDDLKTTVADQLRKLNVPGAILRAVGYSDMDGRAKQQLASAAYRAHAREAWEVESKRRKAGGATLSASRAEDKAESDRKQGKLKIGEAPSMVNPQSQPSAPKNPSATRAQPQPMPEPPLENQTKWMEWWVAKQPAQFHRQVHASAVLYTLDYSNVPWLLDEGARAVVQGVDITPIANMTRRLLIPFGKYPYNYARQIKRLGVDSILDVTLRRKFKTKAERANAAANLAMLSMLFMGARLLIGAGGGDDDEVANIGTSYDEQGKLLESAFNTGSRINISGTPLGSVVSATARMFGDEGADTDDYWLRIRTLPYANVGLMLYAMEQSLAAIGGAQKKGVQENLGDNIQSMIEDFVSTGMGLKLAAAMAGLKGKFDQSKPTTVMAGESAFDLATGGVAPSALLRTATALVDPVHRRTTPAKSLDYNPGALEGIAAKLPGVSELLPPAGRVVPKASALSGKALTARTALEAQGLGSFYKESVDEKGKLVASYPNPETIKKSSRWQEVLRMVGLNVKGVDRERYKQEISGVGSKLD